MERSSEKSTPRGVDISADVPASIGPSSIETAKSVQKPVPEKPLGGPEAADIVSDIVGSPEAARGHPPAGSFPATTTSTIRDCSR